MMAVLVAAVSVNAQNITPEKGDLGVEIGLNPTGNDGGFRLIDNGIRLRYFLTANDALRLRVGWNMTKTDGKIVTSYNSSYGNIDLGLGYERHWGLSDRIDLYAGANAGYAMSFASYDGYHTSDNNGHTRAHQLAAGVMTGIDVYLWKGLYAGVEMGLLLTQTKEREGSINYESYPEHTYLVGGFYCEPALRVGWTF
ncbi:MAG: outer membrane beta-barrel protein [Bacteroidaceae bacterium]|nr:outer membrane beta-barrel protein [Bacteroidaceae bacterium]MBR5962598.1 outer membrane beta-barrel protein [Bacteroidaceae bacterium]